MRRSIGPRLFQGLWKRWDSRQRCTRRLRGKTLCGHFPNSRGPSPETRKQLRKESTNPMPLSADQLKGMWAALLVSWTSRSELDEDTTRENVRRMCRSGVQGVYTHGTTGEFYAQSEEEWRRVARAALEESKALRVPCQIGCTALWSGEVIRRAEFAQKLDAAALQIAFPFWME